MSEKLPVLRFYPRVGGEVAIQLQQTEDGRYELPSRQVDARRDLPQESISGRYMLEMISGAERDTPYMMLNYRNKLDEDGWMYLAKFVGEWVIIDDYHLTGHAACMLGLLIQPIFFRDTIPPNPMP